MLFITSWYQQRQFKFAKCWDFWGIKFWFENLTSAKYVTFFKSGCVRQQQRQLKLALALVAANVKAPVPVLGSAANIEI